MTCLNSLVTGMHKIDAIFVREPSLCKTPVKMMVMVTISDGKVTRKQVNNNFTSGS